MIMFPGQTTQHTTTSFVHYACACVPHSTFAIINQTAAAVRLRGSGAPADARVAGLSVHFSFVIATQCAPRVACLFVPCGSPGPKRRGLLVSFVLAPLFGPRSCTRKLVALAGRRNVLQMWPSCLDSLLALFGGGVAQKCFTWCLGLCISWSLFSAVATQVGFRVLIFRRNDAMCYKVLVAHFRWGSKKKDLAHEKRNVFSKSQCS